MDEESGSPITGSEEHGADEAWLSAEGKEGATLLIEVPEALTHIELMTLRTAVADALWRLPARTDEQRALAYGVASRLVRQACQAGELTAVHRVTKRPLDREAVARWSAGGLPLEWIEADIRASAQIDEVQRWLGGIGVELQKLDIALDGWDYHGDGPVHWTIRNASFFIGDAQGWNDNTRRRFVKQAVDAVHSGDLVVIDPQTLLVYKPQRARDFWDLVTTETMNAWLAKSLAPYRWAAKEAPKAKDRVSSHSSDSSAAANDPLNDGRDFHLPAIVAKSIAASVCGNDWLLAVGMARALERDLDTAIKSGHIRAYSPVLQGYWTPPSNETVFWVMDDDVDRWLESQGRPYRVRGREVASEPPTENDSDEIWIGGRRLWRLSRALAVLVAMPGIGITMEAFKGRVVKAAAARPPKIIFRDPDDGDERVGDRLSGFLDEWLFAQDMNAWLEAEMFTEPFRLPPDGAAPSNRPAHEGTEARQSRRLDRLKALGGDRVLKHGGGWKASGKHGALAQLAREEARAGRQYSDDRDVARDVDAEADRRRVARAMPRV